MECNILFCIKIFINVYLINIWSKAIISKFLILINFYLFYFCKLSFKFLFIFFKSGVFLFS